MNPYFGIIVICLTCLVITSSGQEYEELELEAAWGKYKQDFGKRYPDEIEDARRKQIFSENLKIIIEHNKKCKEGSVTYKMGVNKFTDWTSEEIQRLLGYGVHPKHDSSISGVV